MRQANAECLQSSKISEEKHLAKAGGQSSSAEWSIEGMSDYALDTEEAMGQSLF